MKPEERMHPLIQQALQRYFSYGWQNTLILNLIRYRFHVRLSTQCLKTFREGKSCTPYCESHCPWKDYIMLT